MTEFFENVDIDSVISWVSEIVPAGMNLTIPFSGGVDSATCLAIACKALGPERVIALHIGHVSPEPEGGVYAQRITKMLGVRLLRVDLLHVFNAFNLSIDSQFSKSVKISDEILTIRNSALVYTYIRQVARENNSLVVGTLDLAEILIGFYPKECFYGDFLPIGGLFRAEVRSLGAKLGLPHLPEAFAVSDGCGSISNYVERITNGELHLSENKIDMSLLDMINILDVNQEFKNISEKVFHKTLSCLAGRDVYYPTIYRYNQVLSWINKNKQKGNVLSF